MDGVAELVLSSCWLAVVGWLIQRALSQRNLLQPIPPVRSPAADEAPRIAVVIPVRDEEANIAACLQSLIDQDYPASQLRIVIVDDHSTDATVPIVQAILRNHRHVHLAFSPPLPPGWIGKTHACWIGARGLPADVEWICFIDADVRTKPALLASAVAAAGSAHIDLLSLAPRQELKSFAERLVMPCGLYLLAFYQDLRELQRREGDDATATGQFLLVRRSVYDAAGGHAAVRSVICEDVALARLLKRSGAGVLLCDGKSMLSARMYTGWRTLWPGVAKNLVDMLGGTASALTLAVVAVVLAWAAWLIPLADGVSCASGLSAGCWSLLPARLGTAAVFGLHLAGTSYFGIPIWYGLLFPIGYTVGAFMVIDSVRHRLRGRVQWKGRTYP